MRLAFFGSGAFGLPTLRALAAAHQITAIITQPDRPAGRGGRLTPTPIAAWAAEHLPALPLFKPDKVNQPDVAATIRALPADAWVVIAFGQKLGRSLLDHTFAINLHASLLPRWRGAAPINAAILAGDAQTGNSVITLADRMDAGLILAQSRRPIDPALTAGELHDLLASDGPALIEQVLAAHAANTLHPISQDEANATRAPKLTKDDRRIDFHEPADALRRQIHALTPWPGVTISFLPPPTPGHLDTSTPRHLPIKLCRVQPTAQTHQQPLGSEGILFEPAQGLIACGNTSVLRILEVQPPGKRPMPWQDFIRGAGRALQPGARVAAPPPQEPA